MCRLCFKAHLLFTTSFPLLTIAPPTWICLQEPSMVVLSLPLLFRSSVPSIWGFVFCGVIVPNYWGCDYALFLILIYLVMTLSICQTTLCLPHLLLPPALPTPPISLLPPLSLASCHTTTLLFPPSSSLSLPFTPSPTQYSSPPWSPPLFSPSSTPHQQLPRHHSPPPLLTNPLPSPTIPFSSWPCSTRKLLSFPLPRHGLPHPLSSSQLPQPSTRDPCYVRSKQST